MTETRMTSPSPPRILVVDDDPSILKLVADRCTKAGFEVQTAANGLQAVLMARRCQPQILITDVNMPEVDGLTVCLRLLHPGSKRLEVIVITGRPDPEVCSRCESFGAFYAEKGPDFWNTVQSALAEILPHMNELEQQCSPRSAVRKRPVVLVVDDDPDVEKFLSSRLKKFDLDTVFAGDATRAFRMALRDKPSVIVSDYFMPNGDAQYLLSKLRSMPETAAIPVLVMTGQMLDQQAEQDIKRDVCGRPGAVQVFEKAFDTHELITAIRRYCA